MSPGTTQSPPNSRLSWLPAPSPPKGRREETCLPAMLLYGKGVFGFHFTFVFTLHLQVFQKKRLLECELCSLSVSLRHSHTRAHSLPFPRQTGGNFHCSAAAHGEWGGQGAGEQALKRAASSSLSEEQKETQVNTTAQSAWAKACWTQASLRQGTVRLQTTLCVEKPPFF